MISSCVIGVKPQVQVLPEGIQSVNGSSTDMGCTSALVDSGDVTTCNSQSYLVDGCSPDIDTSTSNWASQLVTVRRNEGTLALPFAHVLLTFGFDTAVALTVIEIDLFLCPDWGIGALHIRVYVDEEYDFVFNLSLPFTPPVQPSQSSCDSLTTVHLSGDTLSVSSYRTFHIIVDLSHNSSIEWVHIGDVRFFGEGGDPAPAISTCPPPTPNARVVSTTATKFNSARTNGMHLLYLTTVPSPTPLNITNIVATTEVVSKTTGMFIGKTRSVFSTQSVFSTPLAVRSTPSHTESPVTGKPEDKPTEKNKNQLTLPLVVAAFASLILLLLLILSILLIKKYYHSKVKQKEIDMELEDMSQRQQVDSNHGQNGEHPPPHDGTLDISNPMYSQHKKRAPPATATGIYSELTVEKVYSDVKGGSVTTTVATDGQEITGMYNLVVPLTPTKSANEIIESATYACIQAKSEESYAFPSELDKTRAMKKKSTPSQPQQKIGGESQVYGVPGGVVEERCVERPLMYADVQVREVPEVPTKSSDLLEYLDTESAVNTGVHSEPINPLDFTRNRFDGGEDAPQFLGPFITESSTSALPSGYQDPAEVTSENIHEKTKLGTGQFGEVVLAETKDLSLKQMRLSKTDDNRNVTVTAAVKKLGPNPSESQREAFEEEVRFMSQIKHPNVLRLLGVCHLHPAFIMMEYTEQGDLNQFLQQFSEIVATASSETQVTPSEMVYMASQIASGMQYLANLKFVHRDLSTRSCFVGARGSIKVGSVGVNTDLYQSSYYQISRNRMMPIRWMATECFSGKYSEKSEMWAFGVTMWELFTLAKQLPYRHLSDEEVIHNSLKREYRQFPFQPRSCPQSVYEVMEMCWAVDMRKRATFQNLNKMLQIVSLVSV